MQIRNVTKTYHQKGKTYRALDEIDLDIEAGTLVALLGPSGSGWQAIRFSDYPCVLIASTKALDEEQSGKPHSLEQC